MSDQEERKKYDSSRAFGSFTKNFGNKAKEGEYHYNQYSDMFEQMSPEEQEHVRRESQKFLKRVAIFGFGFIVFWMIFTRRPHQAYSVVNGELIPVQIQNPYMQQQNPYGYQEQQGPYGYQNQPPQPYGNQQGYQQQGYQQHGYQQQAPSYNSPYNYNPGQFQQGRGNQM